MKYLLNVLLHCATAWALTARADSKDLELVDSATYNNIVDYAGFPILSEGNCARLKNGATLLHAFNITFTDTQAVIWKYPRKQQLVVGIPGTSSTVDMLTDASFLLVPYWSPNIACPSCLVHLGFLTAWNSLAPKLLPVLRLALNDNPGYTTVVSGHSLGGGIAQLAYASMRTGYNLTAAYTFGQPRVGNQAYADYIDAISGANDSTKKGNLFRVTHYNDGVPLLPPVEFGYKHSRTEYWESTNITSSGTTYRCFGQEAHNCVDSTGGDFVNNAHGSYAGLQATCAYP